MRGETLEYSHRPKRAPEKPVLRILALILAILLFAVSIVWCVMTWRSPDRFIFLPGGDVGLGFRSHAGWLQWIEWAPWEANPDYVQWSLPWGAALGAEAALVVVCLYACRRRRAA